MKNWLLTLAITISTAHAGIYVEGDILHPIMNLTERTREKTTDLRIGYTWENWDLSGRYYNLTDIQDQGSVSTAGTGQVGNATDTYASLRLGYIYSGFTFGAGVGSYNRDLSASLGANQNSVDGKNVVGLEVFASYKWMWNGFFVKPELNYIAADVPTHQYNSDGTNSYDATYNQPSLNLLVLAGYQF
jgi:hypothetical protein